MLKISNTLVRSDVHILKSIFGFLSLKENKFGFWKISALEKINTNFYFFFLWEKYEYFKIVVEL